MCISHTYGRYLGEGNGTLLQCSCLENPRDGGAWWAAICRVAQSRTRLKRLSSSSSSSREIPMGWPYLWVSHRCVSHSYGRYLWVSHTCGLAIPMGWPYLWVSHTCGLPIGALVIPMGDTYGLIMKCTMEVCFCFYHVHHFY